MSYKLSGINPLAYMGVEPSTPPQMVVETRPPTINDNNFNLGTYWLIAAPPPTTDWELWILVDLSQGIATWKQLFPGSGGGGADQFDEDTGIAVPSLGIILVKGGENINTVGDNVNKITINLNESIHLPDTSSDGSQGVLFLGATGGIGGSTFLHNYGADNTFVGNLAGNLTLTVGSATDNTGLGNFSLNALTTGSANCGTGSFSLEHCTTGSNNSSYGSSSLSVVTSGSQNCALGSLALNNLTTSNDNVAIGYLSLQDLVSGASNVALGTNSGSNYVGAESNNILIKNIGVAAESNTIRIGTNGSQTAAYMAGVYNQSVGATNAQVWIDNTGKLGTVESGSSGNVIITTFNSSGTWTKNTDTKVVEFYIWNGGSGGASGTQGTAAGSNTFGGGGGSAGSFRYLRMLATFLGASESITVGTGGAGGVAQTVNNTAGNNGSLGGASGVAQILMTTFPYFIISSGGGNNDLFGLGSGVGGAYPIVMDGTSKQASGPQGGGTSGKNGADYGWFATASNPPANVQPQALYVANFLGGSGGAGGSVGSTTGGHGSDFVNIDDLVTLYAGALGGAANIDGNNGVVQPTSGAMVIGGGGGGGGGAQSAARAGNGGNGAIPGGGGGGGGHSLNGTDSGTGGNGANGRVIVVEYL